VVGHRRQLPRMRGRRLHPAQGRQGLVLWPRAGVVPVIGRRGQKDQLIETRGGEWNERAGKESDEAGQRDESLCGEVEVCSTLVSVF
jgi:hypothetical protein